MGIMLTDENEQSSLSARIAREMRSKLDERVGEGDGPDIEEDLVEDSAYMERYETKKNPYFWRIVILVAIAAAIVLGFVLAM